MPIQPIDYLTQLKQPSIQTNIMQGLQTGQALTTQRLQNEQLARAAETKKQYALDLQGVFDNPTPKNMAMMTAKYPGQKDAFKESFGMLTKEQKKNEILKTGQVYSSLLSGNTEVAKDILNESIEASENSGEDTTDLKNILGYIERDPKGATGYIGLVLSSVDEDFSKTFETLGEADIAAKAAPIKRKRENAEIAKLGEDLKLTKAKTNKAIIEGKNLGIEGKKAIVELEALKATGGKDINKIFEQEEKLRKEYTSRIKNFTTAKDAFNKLNASADDATGAGDTALVFSFMKMLDPGSVVRESEFALAQDTAGLMARLKNTAEKVQSGQFLTKTQRADFKRLAKKYMEAGASQEKNVRNGLEKVVKNYSLNSENVFGDETVVETEEVAVVQEGQTPSVEGQRNIVVDF